MRAVSRLSIAVAGVLLLFLLAGVSGWLTRHQWLPPVINHQLEGITLSALHGLTLTRQNSQISAHIDQLRLTSDTGLGIDIDNVQLTDLRSFLRKLRHSDPSTPAQSELRMARVILRSPETSTSASSEVESEPASPDASTPAAQTDASVDALPENDQLSISETLLALKKVPVRELTIEQIYWAEKFDGYLTVSAKNTPGRNITGEVLSSRCESCTVNLALNNAEAHAVDIELQLNYEDQPLSTIQGKINRKSADQSAVSADVWTMESQIQFNANGMVSLLKQLDISLTAVTSDPASVDWNSIAQSLNGEVELTLQGQTPDHLESLASLSNVTATMAASSLSAELPENVLGAPLAVQYEVKEPLSFHISTLSPLVVNSVEGKFFVELTPILEPQIPAESSATPLLQTEVSLATELSIPQIMFNGQYDLARLSPLLNSPRWSATLGNYRVNDLSGRQRFSGNALLPSLNNLTSGQTSAVLTELSVQIESPSPAEFSLSLPQKENPLAALGWQTVDVKVAALQPLVISATKMPGPLALDIPELEFRAEEKSPLKATEKKPAPELAGRITNARCNKLPAVDCSMAIKASLGTLDLIDAATSAEQLELETTGTIKRNPASETIEFSFTNFNLAATEMSSGPVKVSAPELFTQKVICTASRQQTECQIPEMALSVSPLVVEENGISGAVFLREITISNKPGRKHGFNAKAQFQNENLNVQALDQFEASVSSNGRLALSDGQISGVSTVTSGPLKMNSQWTHSLETGKGELKITLPETEFSPNNTLTRAIKGLPVDIINGSAKAMAQLQWPDKGRGRVSLAMKDAGLQVNKSFAVGVNTEVKLQQSGDHWITEKPAMVSIDTVDTGVALSNLHFSLTLSPNGDLTLKNFAAELLEGALTSESVTWNLNGEERRSQFQFTGISIGALAREMESTNFAASGLLDAKIPIVTDKQGITVENGAIQSRPPGGRLRYYGAFSPAMLGSNPQLKLLAGALEDYNYRDINGTITYPLSGDLKLDLKLTGRSEAIDANRDLIINLNLENNIPTMLRSLQASRDLTDVLEKQVQ